MLTKEDLQEIQGMMDRQEARTDAKLDELRDMIGKESHRQMMLVVENLVMPQLQALAEGQQMLLEKLAPRNRVEQLEEEVELLKSVIKLHSKEIAELKKAQ